MNLVGGAGGGGHHSAHNRHPASDIHVHVCVISRTPLTADLPSLVLAAGGDPGGVGVRGAE